MKFTVLFVTLLSITYTSAIKTKIEDPKDKRDASESYSSSAHSPHSYQSQAQSFGQDEGNAISIGAGYSVGGAKPNYVYAAQGAQGEESPYQLQSEGISGGSSGHSYQLAPITLQPGQGLASNDLSELMNQLSQGLNSGAISIPSGGHGATYQLDSQSAHGPQGYQLQGLQGLQGLQLQGLQGIQGLQSLQGVQGLHGLQGAQGGQYSLPQYSFSSPKQAQYSLGGHGSLPVYASSTKGLGNFGSTGPVLFTPQSSAQSAPSHGAPAQSYESAAYSLGEKGHPGFSLSGGSHSLGASYKAISAPSNYASSGNYAVGGKGSFKPSTFIGASVPSESAHAQSGHSASYNVPSFANYHPSAGLAGLASLSSGGQGGSGYGGHGAPSKHMLISSEGLGSLESIASAFSQSGQIASPPRTTYGFPSGSYPSSNVHSASAQAPQYYMSSKYPSSAGFSGGVSYKGPGASHSSVNSYSSAPKYSHGGHSSHYSPKDAQGSYSETSYNTIKYSEELKPRGH